MELFLIQQIMATLFATSNKIQLYSDKFHGDITVRQWMAILAIAHLPTEEASFNNIAEKLGTSKQNVKQLIVNLEKKGYVKTIPSNKDKRAVNVIITDLGSKVAKEFQAMGNEHLSNMAKKFSVEELDLLWKLLSRLYAFDGNEFKGFEERITL